MTGSSAQAVNWITRLEPVIGLAEGRTRWRVMTGRDATQGRVASAATSARQLGASSHDALMCCERLGTMAANVAGPSGNQDARHDVLGADFIRHDAAGCR
jgi:hypothetical protein